MPDNSRAALVIIAAGGLGTRVHPWARFIPKEFYPVAGRPGVTLLLEEIAALGPARVVIVYHPYYEQFAAWTRQVLSRNDHARYSDAAGTPVSAAVPPELAVTLIPQHGPYGDLTSVFNGADHLAAARDGLHVAFADNLYPGPSPLPLLRDACPRDVTVLASRYRRALAASRGILIMRPGPPGQARRVLALVEKPGLAEAIGLEESYGLGNLLMLEGRALLTASFLTFARGRQDEGSEEPKLALAIGAYAREHPVWAVPRDDEVVDLGAPEPLPDRRSVALTPTSPR